jgi:uncharacterized protein (DUF302 family)
MQLDYTVKTDKAFDEAVRAVVDAAGANGFRVQCVHDVKATLAEKGFEREPLSIVEMCNARYAYDVLARDVKIGLMLPCPVMVYEQAGEVHISTMRPTLIADFFPEAALEDVAGEVEGFIVKIMNDAAA